MGRLFGHIQVLEARIAELEGQPKPPTSVKERRHLGSRPTGQPVPRRNAGNAATVDCPAARWPTHRVEHATASCPDCQVALTGGRVCGSRQVITLPRVRARVTEHVVLERTCQKCRKHWAPEPDWSAMTAGRQRMGISVQSEVSVLREECRLPFRVIQRYLKWRFGLGLSVGELAALTRGAGREESRLRQEIRASPVVYGDETGWRQDGRNRSFSLPRCATFSSGALVAWSATSTGPTTCTRGHTRGVGPISCHPPIERNTRRKDGPNRCGRCMTVPRLTPP